MSTLGLVVACGFPIREYAAIGDQGAIGGDSLWHSVREGIEVVVWSSSANDDTSEVTVGVGFVNVRGDSLTWETNSVEAYDSGGKMRLVSAGTSGMPLLNVESLKFTVRQDSLALHLNFERSGLSSEVVVVDLGALYGSRGDTIRLGDYRIDLANYRIKKMYGRFGGTR